MEPLDKGATIDAQMSNDWHASDKSKTDTYEKSCIKSPSHLLVRLPLAVLLIITQSVLFSYELFKKLNIWFLLHWNYRTSCYDDATHAHWILLFVQVRKNYNKQ